MLSAWRAAGDLHAVPLPDRADPAQHSLRVRIRKLASNDPDWQGDRGTKTAHVVERYTRTSADALTYEATIDDAAVFTRPWKITMPPYRRLDKNMQLLEFKCPEFAEELMWGYLKKKIK